MDFTDCLQHVESEDENAALHAMQPDIVNAALITKTVCRKVWGPHIWVWVQT